MFNYEILPKTKESVTVFFDGDLDIDVTEILEDEIIPKLDDYKRIQIDLSQVPFVDSTGIGLLIHLVESIQDLPLVEEVLIKNVQESVKDIFEIIGLEEIIGREVFA